MKIYVNRLPVRGPYGGGAHFINAIYKSLMAEGSKHEPINPVDYAAQPDLILCVGLTNDGQCMGLEQAIMYKVTNPNVKVVLRVNENDARKATAEVDRGLIAVSRHIDGTIFVSDYMAHYFMKAREWHCRDNTVIVNGCDREVFGPREKLNNGKINIVAHHWSDNYMKGFDIYEEIDEFVGKNSDRFTFNYIGRGGNRFNNTNVVNPLSGKKLGDELGKYDVYVSASRHDPGPNHILEAIASEIPTYVHRDGGGCVEFAGKDHVFSDWDDLVRILETGDFKPNENAMQAPSWDQCVGDYMSYLERIVNAR